jgi:hypothetical protein
VHLKQIFPDVLDALCHVFCFDVPYTPWRLVRDPEGWCTIEPDARLVEDNYQRTYGQSRNHELRSRRPGDKYFIFFCYPNINCSFVGTLGSLVWNASRSLYTLYLIPRKLVLPPESCIYAEQPLICNLSRVAIMPFTIAFFRIKPNP